jgi:hypothetical protein
VRAASLGIGLALSAAIAATAAGQQRDSAAVDTTTQSSSLQREVFAYEGGGRDPFMSLLKSGDVRPLITDLKLTTIVYDGRFAARSVAVLRDITNRKIYRVKTGDIVGRLKVTQIRPREVVFTVQEFGFERQETLSLTKQEETP